MLSAGNIGFTFSRRMTKAAARSTFCEVSAMGNPSAGAATQAMLASDCRSAGASQNNRRHLTNPTSVQELCDRIRRSLAQRALEDAVEALRDSLAVEPFNMHLLAEQKTVALALSREGFWEDAATWLERALELEPWDQALQTAYARVKRPDYLIAEIKEKRTGKTLRRYAAREGAAYIYTIDIAGTCNLRCPTCPVGNSELAGRPRGLMSYALFERIIDKICREKPCHRPIINLYNWGEPLLNPELPRMIGLLRERGLRSALSSNLNIKRGLEEVIAANPDELKISLSGFTQETYERAHAGGDLDWMKTNMRLVRAFLDRHHATTHVWVGHHIYRSNQVQIPEVRAFCMELGFAYHPITAFYMPLERLIDYLEGKPNPRDKGIIEDLLRKPEEIPRGAAARRSGHFDCELRFNQTVINHDGSVALCCTVYDRENMLGVNFLDADFAELEARKYAHPFCETCYRYGLEYAPFELFPRARTEQGA
jgi:MoaA/NifB/PqqE/SkfB family radical SAM enzyme